MTTKTEDQDELTLEEARKMHDVDLRELNHPAAQQVLDGRTEAADQIRLVLARMYQHNKAATFDQWHIMPCVTGRGTIGVVDIAGGTAWDSGVEVHEGIADLGLAPELLASANGNEGTVSIDGQVVQAEGTSVIDGKIVRPAMPDGWEQILLPTWRTRRLELEEYREHPLRPTLVCYGLRTCYDGRPGLPLRRLCCWHENRGDYPEAASAWIAPKWEQLDPAWWPLTDEQSQECTQILDEWFGEANTLLDERTTHQERELKPHSFPDQLVPFGFNASSEERDALMLDRARGTAAGKAALTVLQTLTGQDIERDRPSLGSRRWDALLARLAVIVDHRLRPVFEALQWMLSQDDLKQSYSLGSKGTEFGKALQQAGFAIGMALLRGWRPIRETTTKMAHVHIRGGPVYVDNTDPLSR